MTEQYSDWVALLKKSRLFSTLTHEELLAIAKKLIIMSLPKGAILFKRGDPGDAFYLVHSGRLQILTGTPDPKSPIKFPERAIAYLGRGESLGEMALLTGETRTTTARADMTSELLVLFKTDFDRLLLKKPSVAVHLSRSLSARLASASQVATPAGREADVFLTMALLPAPDEIVFTLNLALSLVQQTRRKIALVELADEPGTLPRFLGLCAPETTEAMLERENLHDPERVGRLAATHPSGLEVFSFSAQLLRLGDGFPIFLKTLREAFDHVLIRIAAPNPFLPPSRRAESVTLDEISGIYATFLQPLIEQADKILVALGPEARNPAGLLGALASTVSEPNKIRKVWIAVDGAPPPAALKPDFRVPWRADLVPEFDRKRSPYVLDGSPLTQRSIDGLARFLGRLRIGLAMGSGAAFGYTIIGILKVLEREGITPDVISGTSMGALIGAFYAAGKNPEELEQIASSITKAKLWSMADLTLPRSGVVVGRGVLTFLKSILGEATFHDLQIPFACVATDIRSGEEVVLKEGRVAEAVRASLSLPFFFQPHFWEGRYLVDGGLVNPVPTSVAVNLGADILISVNLTTKPSQKRIPLISGWKRQLPADLRGPGLFEILIKTIYTMQHEIAMWRTEVAHAVLEPDTSEFTWAEFHRAPEIMKMGGLCAEETLPKIKALLPFFAQSCKIAPGPPLRKSF